MSTADDIPGGTPPDGGPRAALSGAIVPDGRRGFNATVDPDVVEEVVRQRLSGRTATSVAAEFGISKSTVANWVKALTGERSKLDPEAARGRLSVQFETVVIAAWEEYRQAAGTTIDKQGLPVPSNAGTRKDALTRVESALRALAILHGANAPTQVRAEVTVNEVTEQDRELQEMIREARARNAIIVEQVEAESDEPSA